MSGKMVLLKLALLLLLGAAPICVAQSNESLQQPQPDKLCPLTCLDVIQGYRYRQIEPIQTTNIVDAVPLVRGESHMFIYQNPFQCSLDLFVVHESVDSSSSGQALMKFQGIDMTNATLKSGDATSSRILYDPDNLETDVFWEWKDNGDGMATEWLKDPTPGACFEVTSTKLIKGLDYWRFVSGPVRDDGKVDALGNHMYLDQDDPLVVCVGSCGDVPGSLPQKPVPPPPISDSKKFVIYAGPHETGGNPIVEFLSDGARSGGAMDGWIWPTIEMNGKTIEHPFDYYVRNEQNDTVWAAVFEGIRNAWNESEHGVVIGASEFDKIGENPYSGSNAIQAVFDLVKYLDVPVSDVIVVLTYRTPRISHWAATQKHFDFNSYEEFMCDDDESRNRWEWLDTAINPFKLSIAFADMGWNVEVIDYSGIQAEGLDVAHQIACSVMSNVECDGAWVKNLKDVVMPPLNTATITTLSAIDQKDLEEMLLSRDCYFKYLLQERPNFNVLHWHKTWTSCSAQHFTLYQRFADTDFLTNAMKSQVSCSNEPLDVHDVMTSKMLPNQNSLVVLAGPRETNDAQVTKFFADQTSGSFLRDPSPSFSGWGWPRAQSVFLHQQSTYDAYDLLVSYPDDSVVQNLLLDTLRDDWNKESRGIIIGSSNFERVGHNPSSGYDPLRALKRVVDELRVSPEDVTVVLNYRSPRVYQWNALFQNHFTAKDYKSFLCSQDEFEKRWEFLDTVMNPLRVASAYRSEGYKVVIVDQAGVAENKKDVAHAIACSIMDGVNCNNDWVTGLEDETVETFVADALPDVLSDNEWAVLENYFTARDCYHMYELDEDKWFTVLYQKELWKKCQQAGSIVDYAQVQYTDLVDTNFFLELLQSQVRCSSGSASDLSDMWSGNNNEARDNTITIIVTSSLLGLLVVVIAIFCLLRRRGGARQAKTLHGFPSEGVFVNDPKIMNFHSPTEEIVKSFRNGIAYGEDDEAPTRPTTPSSAPPASAFKQNKSIQSDICHDLGDQPKKSFESVEMDDEYESNRSHSPAMTFV
jgi:hypothetical protein